jgi:hypothetical protein
VRSNPARVLAFRKKNIFEYLTLMIKKIRPYLCMLISLHRFSPNVEIWPDLVTLEDVTKLTEYMYMKMALFW